MKMEGRCECKTALKRLPNVFQTFEDEKNGEDYKMNNWQKIKLAAEQIRRQF